MRSRAWSSALRHLYLTASICASTSKRAMAVHTADERFTPVKRGVATLDIWVMVAFAVITIWVLFFV